MTCKDCFHYDVCEALFECFGVRIPYHDNETCQKFKDRKQILIAPIEQKSEVVT